MRSESQIRTGLLVLAAAGLIASGAYGGHEMHGRVSYDAGDCLLRGAEESDWSHAGVNALILPGDTVWVDERGTVEIEMPGGVFFRMADRSKAEIAALPPGGKARGWWGSFYVQRLRRSRGSFVLETPGAAIGVEPDTCVRVDVLEDGATTVSVRWGRSKIRTDAGGSVVVDDGERSWVDPGYLPSMPVPYDRTDDDAFDAWNRERTQFLAKAPDTLPRSLTISEPTLGLHDLAGYGEWVYISGRNYWRPTVAVDYVPYRVGHWTYLPAIGNVWVGDQPFCYMTSHYGRWHHFGNHGWVWSYDPVWSPAWAATIRCGDYYAWTPIGYDCNPVVVYESSCFEFGGVRFGLYASTYVRVGNLHHGPHSICAVDRGVARYISDHPRDVHIWNINAGRQNHVRLPRAGSSVLVRNYNPSRAIRGAATGSGGRHAADHRVRRLEEASRRRHFGAVTRTGDRGVRTRSASRERVARLRRVRIDRQASVTGRVSRITAPSSNRNRSSGTSPTVRRSSSVRSSPSAYRTRTQTRTPSRTSTASTPPRMTRTPVGGARTSGERVVIPRTRTRSTSPTVVGTSTPTVRQSSTPARSTSRPRVVSTGSSKPSRSSATRRRVVSTGPRPSASPSRPSHSTPSARTPTPSRSSSPSVSTRPSSNRSSPRVTSVPSVRSSRPSSPSSSSSVSRTRATRPSAPSVSQPSRRSSSPSRSSGVSSRPSSSSSRSVRSAPSASSRSSSPRSSSSRGSSSSGTVRSSSSSSRSRGRR